MPGAHFLAIICERTATSADWLLLGRGGQSVLPWTASRSREDLEQDLAIHVHAHIRQRDNQGAFNVVEGHGQSTDWLVDGCGLMNSLLLAEEQRIRDWAAWEHKIDSLLHVSDDIVESLNAFVPLLPEKDTELGVLVGHLGEAAVRARSITYTLDAPAEPNCIRRYGGRATSASIVGPRVALQRLLDRLKRAPQRPGVRKFKFSATGKFIVAPLDENK
jgi:hypothetical protein